MSQQAALFASTASASAQSVARHFVYNESASLYRPRLYADVAASRKWRDCCLGGAAGGLTVRNSFNNFSSDETSAGPSSMPSSRTSQASNLRSSRTSDRARCKCPFAKSGFSSITLRASSAARSHLDSACRQADRFERYTCLWPSVNSTAKVYSASASWNFFCWNNALADALAF